MPLALGSVPRSSLHGRQSEDGPPPPTLTPLIRLLGTGCGGEWLPGAAVAGPRQQQRGLDSREDSSWGTAPAFPGEADSPPEESLLS